MKITWIGHSCFKVESNGFTAVLDPYEPGSVPGLANVDLTANAVLCSHEHGDHNARGCVKVVETEAAPLQVVELNSFHDDTQGSQRGKNIIRILSDGKIKVAHMGDQGCDPTAEQMETLKGVDVLLMPVGGHFTVDGNKAAELTKVISPKVVVPMHFRDDVAPFGFGLIDTADTFLNAMGVPAAKLGDTLDTDSMPSEQIVVLTPERLGK